MAGLSSVGFSNNDGEVDVESLRARLRKCQMRNYNAIFEPESIWFLRTPISGSRRVKRS